MRLRLARLDWLDRVALGYVAVYLAWMVARTLGLPVPQIVGDAAFYPLGPAVAWVNWRNSRVAGLDRRTRVAWQLLTIAALALWASGSVWTVWQAAGASPTWAARIDRLAFVEYALSIAAYLWFPGRAFPRRGGRRFVLDVALIIGAGVLVALYTALRLLRPGTSEATILLVVELCFDWALFVVAAIGCMQKRDRIIRRVLILLLLGNLVSMAGNYILGISPGYRNGDPVDLFWFGAWVLRWAAARLAWRHYATEEGRAAPALPAADGYRSNPFAYVLVGGAFVLLFAEILAKDHALLGMLTMGAIALGGLLIVRQYAELEENRRLFEAQIDRESRFKSLVQNSSDVVIVVNEQGVVSYASPSVESVFGADSLVRPGIPFSSLLDGDDARIVEALVAGRPQATGRFEAAMTVAPARSCEVEAVWTDLRHDPAVRGIVINCRDVSDRNEAERRLRQRQKLDAVGHLAGGLAHDLNNVLAIIRGYTELLRSELPPDAPGARDLDQIVSAVDRASAVTGKVLSFSRRQPAELKLLDLSLVIRELEPMLRQLTKDRVELGFELADGLWLVRADQGQMEQVAVNLCANAHDAMPDGGRLRIATGNRRLEATHGPEAPPGEYVALTVSDEGVGIAPAVAARIFEPFFTTRSKERGMGLGLSMVQGIAKEMGGRVGFETAEGRGSTFTVLLPRAALPSEAEARGAPAPCPELPR